MTDVRFVIRADGEGATREVERVKKSLNTLPAASRTAQGGLDGLGMSAAQTAQAMRQVPMQITDVVTSLASGMPVYMVAIQQGGQLKDTFGGIVPAAKALSSTIAGMVNPFTLAAAAAAAVGAAWYQGQQEAQAYAKALILSGNAIGMTTGQIQQMASTQGLAASSLAEMAGSSNIAARDLARFTSVAVEWERVTGQAVGETRKQFESLAKSPVDALIELNDGTNFLTVSVLDQVAALQEQGKETEAAEVAQRAYADALESRADDVQESTNKMVRAWSLVAREAAAAWAEMVRQWDDETPADQLAKLDQQIAALEGKIKNRPNRIGGLLGQWLGDDPAQLAGLKAQRDSIAETIRLSERAQLVASERAAAERKAVAERVQALKDEEDARRRADREAESASKARIRSLEQERQAREKLEGIISSALGRDDERQRKEEVEAAEAAIKVWEQEAEARTKAYEAADKQVTSFATLLTNIQLETQYLQMSNQEREFATAMRELEVLGVEKGTAAWEAYAEALRGAIGERATVKAGIEASAALVRSGERAADQVGQAFAQSIMDGGKSAAEQLERLFGSMVLTPMVNPFTLAQAVTGAFSGGGSSGGGSSLSSMASLAGSLGSFGSFAATGAMNTIAGTGMMSGLSAAGSLMSGGSIAGGLGMGLGAVAPYAMAAIALYQLLSSGGEKRAGSTYGYSASDLQYGQGLNGIWSDEVAGMIGAGSTRFIGGPSGGEIGGDTIRQSVAATVQGINGLFDRLGSTEKIDQFWGKLEQSEKGRGGVFAGGTLASGASFGEAGWEAGTSRTLTTDEAIAAFALDLQQATVQALQTAADIPAVIGDMLTGVDAEALSQEQVGALLQSVEAVIALTEAVGRFGVASEAVTTAMLTAAGGTDALAAGLSSYWTEFYSEAERTEFALGELGARFGDLGYSLPATRDGFRDLVESLDLTTEEGQATYGTLVSLSGAFAAAVPAAESFAAQIADVGAAARAAADALSGAESAYADALGQVEAYVEGAAAAVIDAEGRVLAVRQQAAGEYEAAASALTGAQNTVTGVMQQIAGVVEASSQRVASAQAAVAAAHQRVADVARQTADRMRSLGSGISEYLVGLGTSPGGIATSGAQLSSLRALLSSTSGAALGGDADAAADLPGLASDLLEASRNLAPDAAAYAADEVMVRRLLGQVRESIGSQYGTGTAAADASTDALAQAQRELADAMAEQSRVAQATQGLDVEQLAATRSIESLMADLFDAQGAVADAAWAMQSAADTLAAVGDAPADSRDLVAEYGDAIAALTTAQDHYAAVLAQTADVNTSMLANQDTLAGLLADLAIASARLSAAQSDTPSDAALRGALEQIYQTELGRSMEDSALAYWQQEMAAGGYTLDDVQQFVRESAEAIEMASQSIDERVAYLLSRSEAAGYDYSPEYLRSLILDGSHASGLEYVPRNGYIAQLHQGERVLTAGQARSQDAMVEEMRQMRAEMRAGLAAIASHTDKIRKLEEKWDVDGLPLERTT